MLQLYKCHTDWRKIQVEELCMTDCHMEHLDWLDIFRAPKLRVLKLWAWDGLTFSNLSQITTDMFTSRNMSLELTIGRCPEGFDPDVKLQLERLGMQIEHEKFDSDTPGDPFGYFVVNLHSGIS